MKSFKKISRLLLGLFSILVLGLSVGYGLSTLNQDSKDSNLIHSDEAVIAEDSNQNESNFIVQIKPPPQSIDQDLIENTIFELVNQLRSEQSVKQLKKNEVLKLAAEIRAVEIEESFSHTRPNGTEPFTVLSEKHTNYDYFMAGENLAMATYHRDDEYMAQLIFNGWVESNDHYKTMINPDFEEIGIGVHYDGKILYCTQFFGESKK